MTEPKPLGQRKNWVVIECPRCKTLLDYNDRSMAEVVGCAHCGESFHPENAKRLK